MTTAKSLKAMGVNVSEEMADIVIHLYNSSVRFSSVSTCGVEILYG